jgi:hypothetical protein
MNAKYFVGLKWVLIASAAMLGGNPFIAQAQNRTLSVTTPITQSCEIVFGAARDRGAVEELCSVASSTCGDLNQENFGCYAKTINPGARANRSKSGSLTTAAPSSSFSASPKK